MTLANKVTIGRILLTPILIIALFEATNAEWWRYLAASLLFVVGIGDAVDGYLAKKRNEETELGKFLDPIADKFVVISLCLILYSHFWVGPHLPFWLFAVILFREIFVVGGFLSLSFANIKPNPWPCLMGRVNNNVQHVMYGFVIVGNVMPDIATKLIQFSVGITCIVSLLAYTWLFFDILKQRQSVKAGVNQSVQEVT
ncbi:MAG: CDP-alcohol phosphatidyltransferase family protein [Candidatus Brocadiales bacterium]|nr:CDP-alcohol phosphatidyltransferase family protein [Candidatus Bathyanammoxibius sp.]